MQVWSQCVQANPVGSSRLADRIWPRPGRPVSRLDQGHADHDTPAASVLRHLLSGIGIGIRRWLPRRVLRAAFGAAMLAGATAAVAQGLPSSLQANSDLPWSINQRPDDWPAHRLRPTIELLDQTTAPLLSHGWPVAAPPNRATASIDRTVPGVK